MIELNIDNLLGNKYSNASFHDAVIHTMTLDYVSHEAKLDCEIGIYGPDDTDDDPERTRRGTLKLTGLLYFVIEPPDGSTSFEEAIGIEVSEGGAVSGTQFKKPIPNLPKLCDREAEAAFVHWLYIYTWNAFIFFAATGASFEWE